MTDRHVRLILLDELGTGTVEEVVRQVARVRTLIARILPARPADANRAWLSKPEVVQTSNIAVLAKVQAHQRGSSIGHES